MLEPSVHKYHEYLHPEYLDSSLICQICRKPWIEPMITPCDNMYCRMCINEWLDENYLKCPACSESVLKKHLTPLTDPAILDKLNQIHVKCILCHQTDIERGIFPNHLYETCPKAAITCSTKENQCPWIGLREQFDHHRDTCLFRTPENKNNHADDEEAHGKGHFLPFTKVSLNQRQFHNQDVATAVRALIINRRCTWFDLFHQGITSEGALIIASALENNLFVEALELRNNFICDSGVQAFAHALSTDRSALQRLDLNGNAITDIGVRILVDMLRINKTLLKLTLSFNRITNEGVEMFVNVLIDDNSTLQWLSLAGHPGIDDTSTPLIVRLLTHNHSLKTLNFENCPFSWLSKKHMHFTQTMHLKSDFELIF